MKSGSISYREDLVYLDIISWKFILFFLVAMLMLLPQYHHKKAVLVLFNSLFCLLSGGVYAFLSVLFVGIISFLGGWVIYRKKSKSTIAVFIIITLLPLFSFKYSNFVFNSILHLQIHALTQIAVPIGISFYTMQAVSYLVNVYRDNRNVSLNLVDYFIYMSLFTCFTSGPINRSQKMLAQIKTYNKIEFNYDRCVAGLQYILLGGFLKVFIAGRMSAVVAVPFSNVSNTEGIVFILASICYTIQIFCDFCGYSYIAFGLSKIIGLDVIQNFQMPYASKSITEFWRRWHISLSSWLTDYVYIPLGGSKCSRLRSNINVLITFAISGLWHGASWNFIAWGILNGLFIVGERLTGMLHYTHNKFKDFLHWLLTMLMVNTMWIFFRANSLTNAITIIRKIFFYTIPEVLDLLYTRNVYSILSQLGVTFFELCITMISVIAFVIFELWIDRSQESISVFQGKPLIVRWLIYFTIIIPSYSGRSIKTNPLSL